MSDESLAGRVETLEIELSYARRTIDELSEVIAGQAGRIDLLEGKLEALVDALKTLQATGEMPDTPADQEPPPPHY